MRGNSIGPRQQSHPAGRIAWLVLALTLGLQVATQFAAYRFGYDVVLGAPAYGERIYYPWAILVWANKWNNLYPGEFKNAATAGTAATLALLAAALWAVWRKRQVTDVLHGSARWATASEVRRAGLLRRDRGDSVVVGAWRDGWGRTRYLRHSGPEHVLGFAPPRSGKGVGLVIPTLLTWKLSAVVTDLKAELWALTAGWRAAIGHQVYRFDPTAEHSAKWNPLDEIRKGTPHEIGDAKNLAGLLVDHKGDGSCYEGEHGHFPAGARSLLAGLIPYVLHRPGPATMPAIDQALGEGDAVWPRMLAAAARMPPEIGEVVAATAREMIAKPERERGSIVSTAVLRLDLWRNPVVARNCARSDFHVRDLMHGPRPVSLYLVTQPADKDELKPLLRILLSMVVRKLASDLEFEGGQQVAGRGKLLMLMDEAPSYGRLGVIEDGLATVSGFGIKFYLICQDTVQLRAAYGANEAITANCAVQAAMATARHETAIHLSELIGETTVPYEAQSRMRGGQERSKTEHWTRRALLTPDEIRRLPGPTKDRRGRIRRPGDMIILVAGQPPIYGKQPLYFRDGTLMARAKIPAPRSPKP